MSTNHMDYQSCYCDYDPPEFYHRKETAAAKKEHKCTECGCIIKIGESYERVRGKWEGCISTFKTCSDCWELRDALDEMPCFCWAYGGMLEDAVTQFQEADFSPGLRFSYLRILAKHRCNKK